MLGTHAKEPPDLIHLFEHIDPIHLRLSTARIEQPRQHRQCSSLASAVMAQQCEYLTRVHLEVETFDSLEAIGEGLLQIGDLQDPLLLFLFNQTFIIYPFEISLLLRQLAHLIFQIFTVPNLVLTF